MPSRADRIGQHQQEPEGIVSLMETLEARSGSETALGRPGQARQPGWERQA